MRSARAECLYTIRPGPKRCLSILVTIYKGSTEEVNYEYLAGIRYLPPNNILDKRRFVFGLQTLYLAAIVATASVYIVIASNLASNVLFASLLRIYSTNEPSLYARTIPRATSLTSISLFYPANIR